MFCRGQEHRTPKLGVSDRSARSLRLRVTASDKQMMAQPWYNSASPSLLHQLNFKGNKRERELYESFLDDPAEIYEARYHRWVGWSR